MRQAIITRYLYPSMRRGERVKATAKGGSITIEWDATLSPEQNHSSAAKELARIYSWTPYATLHGGTLPDGSYCFVLIDKQELASTGGAA